MSIKWKKMKKKKRKKKKKTQPNTPTILQHNSAKGVKSDHNQSQPWPKQRRTLENEMKSYRVLIDGGRSETVARRCDTTRHTRAEAAACRPTDAKSIHNQLLMDQWRCYLAMLGRSGTHKSPGTRPLNWCAAACNPLVTKGRRWRNPTLADALPVNYSPETQPQKLEKREKKKNENPPMMDEKLTASQLF